MVNIIEAYLKENIDEQVMIKNWKQQGILPFVLRNNYEFYELNILGNQYILAKVTDETTGIQQLQKQVNQIENLTQKNVVLLYKDQTRYRRKSLIENRIPFLIADGQMYLPQLGLDLKRTSERHKEITNNAFTNPAQIAYLYFLYNQNCSINTTDYAEAMGISQMTASRALNELYDADLLTYEIGGKTGRSKEYRRIGDPEYFLKGKGFLKTPIAQIVYSKKIPKNALIAGQHALAELSMLNHPKNIVVAIDRSQLKTIESEIIRNVDIIKDEIPYEIELWNYNPHLFSVKNHVDLLSLYASLKDIEDERIEQALEEALKGEKWYTG